MYRTNRPGLGMLDFLFAVLPAKGRILEAGCGTGYIVHALRERGFDCIGIDNADSTIQAVLKACPGFPVSVGNVLDTGFEEESFDGIVSLGVAEHREQGPEPFLAEAFRVLKRGGTAVITVPHFNTVRRLKAALKIFPDKSSLPAEAHFYQYAFSRAEMETVLRKEGFQVARVTGYDAWKGLKDELWPFNWLNKSQRLQRNGRKMVDAFPSLLPLCGHMIAFICKK
jgi:2-polyprenyl-3-methyl-5-hydroxy-6-metoxy-1,4-benzoquinol methylase